jgi:hypothetical protein
MNKFSHWNRTKKKKDRDVTNVKPLTATWIKEEKNYNKLGSCFDVIRKSSVQMRRGVREKKKADENRFKGM